MTARVFNFSPGPAVLPLSVLEEAQRDLLAIPGEGVSVLEISHRSKWFIGVVDQTIAQLKQLLGIGDEFAVLFLQGGSRLQFSMVPMNLMAGGQTTADYIVTGTWGKMAAEEATRQGTIRTAYTSKATNFDRLPQPGELKLSPEAAYVHFTSNETIQGVQFLAEPETGAAPLVCDASSDFLCRPLDMRRYGLLYACAQKNSGPAGVTVVIVRKSLLERSSDTLPTMLNYAQHAKENSLLNTPPCFAIYLVNLVTKWLIQEIGGLEKMLQLNRRKAKLLYDAIDSSGGFYRGHAQPACRSLMNVTFNLPDDARLKQFLAEAEPLGLRYLAGHRSVGGVRASIYNAMPLAGVEKLAEFMDAFRKRS